jgi:hypothetical protein
LVDRLVVDEKRHRKSVICILNCYVGMHIFF